MKKLFLTLLFKAIIISGFCGQISFAQSTQPAPITLISSENYERTLDATFTETEKKTALRYSVVLRFMPSRNTESEITVQVDNKGQVHATLSTVTGTSVWNLANEYIQRTGIFNLEEITRRVQVRRQEISIDSTKASIWHSEALKSLGQTSIELQQDFIQLQKTGEVTIFLDGSIYEMRFTQGVTEIRCAVMDAEVDDHKVTGRSSLVKWMNSVRLNFWEHAKK